MEVLIVRPSRRHVLALAAAIFLGSATGQENEAPVAEYAVKAALLFKFLRFLEWPEAARPRKGDPFRIGILGNDPFEGHLEKAVSGKTVDDHPITIVRSHDVHDVQTCPVVFICNSKKDDLEKILTAMGNVANLTVADTDGFAERGVMINLVLREKKVKFQINYEAAREVGIEVDAQLLKLAELVGPDDPEQRKARG
jgi:hypothetical protein